MRRDGHLTRIRFNGTVRHEGGQQFVNGKGFAGDDFEDVHRLEPHGFASHPVEGGVGMVMQTRARDSAYVVGGENPAMRPAIDAGGTAIYDSRGNIVSIVEAAIRIVHATEIVIVAPMITVQGDLDLQGNLTVSGDGTFAGVVTDSDGNNGA
jgi:phage gp45-like